MLSFNERVPSSIKVDWSLYGGAEQTGPPASASTRSSPLSREDSPSAFSHNETATSITTDSDEDAETVSKIVGEAKDGKQWLPNISKTPQDSSDFLWMLTEEPHRTRRMAILKAHPEVRSLMGFEPFTKYVSFGVLALQVGLAVMVSRLGWHPLSFKFLVLAYAIGGTANHNVFLAIHEITHNLAFKGIRTNKAWAIFVNLSIGVPYAMAFKPYHLEHHKYLGEDGVDTDLPTKLELICLKNVLGKAFFVTFQIFFYALRPGFVRAQRPTIWHLANVVTQLIFNFILVKTCGWTAMLYLLFSSFFAGSLHPCAANFIAEHYMFGGIQQETWSYYGPLNILAYNVGYHNEHHDFPSVPWTRLPVLRKMAPEFYDILPHHTSWSMVTVQFIFGPNSGLFSRIKRVNKEKRRIAKVQ